MCLPLRNELGLSKVKSDKLLARNGCEEFCRRVRKSGRLMSCPRESTGRFFRELIELLSKEEDFKISLSTKPDSLMMSFKKIVTETFRGIAKINWEHRGFNDIELPMTIEGQIFSEIAQNLQKTLMNVGWRGKIDISAKNWLFTFEINGEELVLRGGIEREINFQEWCKIHQKVAPLILKWI